METITKKRFTRSSFKKFIKENMDNLYVLAEMDFDGMTDCVSEVKGTPRKVNASEVNFEKDYTFGINGIWLVGDSMDYFTPFEDEMFKGVEISNCCGRYKLGVMK